MCPMAAGHPCAKRGCPAIVRGPGRYCVQHTAEAQRESDTERGSASERGYGARWRRLRLAFLSQHPLCEECQRRGRIVAATDVDHIVPRRQGGSDEASNLQALCHECHSRKTATEDGGWGVGGSQKSGNGGERPRG